MVIYILFIHGIYSDEAHKFKASLRLYIRYYLKAKV